MSQAFSGFTLNFKNFVTGGRGKARVLGGLFFLLAAVAILGFLLTSGIQNASAVTNVTLADNDTTGSGLDGRDFTVSWTPLNPAPNGFQSYQLFILTTAMVDASAPTAGTILTNYCGGNPCRNTGFFNQQGMNTSTLPQFEMQDSNNSPFGASSYKACVLTQASVNTLVCSGTGTTPMSDSVADMTPPNIDHLALLGAVSGQNANVMAFVRDDQTTAAQFGDANDGQPEFFRLCYGNDVSAAETCVNPGQAIGSLFPFTIPSNALPAQGQMFEYYLMARDRANNQRFFCASPSAASANDCKASPFGVQVGAVGSRTISGTVTSGGSPVNQAMVFAAGASVPPATTDAQGNYTLTGLPSNSAFDITAYKAGFCENKRFETIGTSNLSDINLSINAGECTFGGGGGGQGGGGRPHVVFSGPPEGGSAALNESLRVGFDQALGAATVNDTDPTNMGSNVYLTSDGNNRVAGVVTYCANNQAPGCSALFSQDLNTILFDPTADLTANTNYILVITEAVTGETGQSVEGNRQGGGHEVHFNTGGGTFTQNQIEQNFGQTGQFSPPFVESMTPAPGIQAAPNTKIIVTFNQEMNTQTLTTQNILLKKNGQSQQISVSVDNNTKRVVTITPASALAAGDYDVEVLGAVANTQGVTLRPPDQISQAGFASRFLIGGSNDTAPPSIFPSFQTGVTGFPVNSGVINFGFSEQIDPTTLTTSTVTLQRGSTTVPTTVEYDPGANTFSIIPSTVLAPNTAYTVTFGTSVRDLAANVLTSSQAFNFTTGTSDSTTPKLSEVRCDDFNCVVVFNEPMNNEAATGSAYANSVLNLGNYTLTQNGTPVSLTGKTVEYDSVDFSARISGLGLTVGADIQLTVNAAARDLSDNAIVTTNSANVFQGKVEPVGTLAGNEGGMFGPPPTSLTGGSVGGEFVPQGFGNFTAEQFALGQADAAYPFNPAAGQDANVFQVRFNPGVVLQNGDQVVVTLPTGSGVANAIPDSQSPFRGDFNQQQGAGTVTFDTGFDTDGVQVDATARTVTVQLAISGGTPGANDQYTIDLRRITNPLIPKGPESGGYTADIKVKRAGQAIVNKTPTPYFINQSGSRSITVRVFAGSQQAPVAGANGNFMLFAGGPSGHLDRVLTMTNGAISAVDGTAGTQVSYSGLQDGCYFIGTEPIIALGGIDYFGQDRPGPVCVDSNNTSPTRDIILTSAQAAGASVPLTVKFSGNVNLQNSDIDIFAGGPGRFVVKTVTGVGVPDANGYVLRLPSNGQWFVGFGPALPKSASGAVLKPLPVTPPPQVGLVVSGLPTTPTISTGFQVPPGVSFNAQTNTLTFTFAAADKVVSGTVTNGSTGIANVRVFMHKQGFGASVATATKSDGTFSLNVSEFGSYELGAEMDGLPPRFSQIEVAPDGADAGSDPDIFFLGKQITGQNPLVVTLRKPAFTISGKVLDAGSNAIAGAPVFGTDANNNFVQTVTSSDGSYTVFVAAGVWTLRSELPPNKTDGCGTFSKSVTVTTESQSNQNITPVSGSTTCVNVSGSVTIGGTAMANGPLGVQEWNASANAPVAAGFFRPASTDSSGNFSVKVIANKTYRISTWNPNFGELAITQVVAGANVENIALTSGAVGTVTFAFTGGAADMSAFIELKKSDDQFARVGRTIKGLNQNAEFSVKAGTYNYFVDVFGVGKFNGTVATGSTATIDLSTSTMITVSGNVNDGSQADLAGALLTFTEADGTTITATTDSSGNYTARLEAGSYTVTSSLGGYVPGGAAASATFNADTANFDVGGAAPDVPAMDKATQVIRGTVTESNGTTPVTEGSVFATNSSGAVITAPINPQDGSYSLPVDDDSWTVKAIAPLHSKTTRSGGAVSVSGSDVTGTNITLTQNSSNVPKSTSKAVAASTGGTVDDTSNTGVKFTAGSGVLAAGSTDVTMNVERTFTAPDAEKFQPLAGASFDISATTSSSVKDLNGTAEIQISYTDILSSLPSSVSESDLKLAYYDTGKATYVPVEGGFTVDPTNNTITGAVTHLTSFVVIYPAVATTTTSGGSSATDMTAPAAATSIQLAAQSSPAKVTITWTDPADSDLAYVDVLRDDGQGGAVNGVALSSVSKGVGRYEDTSVTAGRTYKYILRSRDTAGNVRLSAEQSVTVQVATTTTTTSGGGGGGGGTSSGTTTTAPPATGTTTDTGTTTTSPPAGTTSSEAAPATAAAPVATLIHDPSNLDTLLAGLSLTRSQSEEAKYMPLIQSDAIAFKVGLTAEQEAAITNFVSYGVSAKTKMLGAGERRAVLRDYLETVARGNVAWVDIERMTNGEKPVARNLAKERAQVGVALKVFKAIFGHAPNFSDHTEDLAWNTLLYRIRFTRDLVKEREGIAEYRAIFGRLPRSPMDWAAVRVLGYVQVD